MADAAGSLGRAPDATAVHDSAFEPARGARCHLCGSTLELVLDGVVDTRFGTPGHYQIQRCVRCGLEQTVPVPSLSELKSLYEVQYNFGGEKGTLYTRLRHRFFFSFLNRAWAFLDGDVSFYQARGRGRLIDIGCNEGRGLPIYAHNGFQVEGLELNETAAAEAREGGFTVHTQLLENFYPPAPYNVAVLANVLEHSLDPRTMLLDVRRILEPGGSVWISCPNSRSWLRKALGRFWINWHVPFHISHFSPETLEQLLAETGYERVRLRQITPAVWVAQSLIARFFATTGKKNRQLRNPFLTLFFMLFARFVMFPALWLGNRLGCGDCLIATATKA